VIRRTEPDIEGEKERKKERKKEDKRGVGFEWSEKDPFIA